MKNKILSKNVIELLEQSGTLITHPMRRQLERYLELIEEWNEFASLVSRGDLAMIAEEHLPDCLSLVPYIARSCREGRALLDIGSGSGLPAVPIKIVLPELPVVMVERNGKKVGFLRKVCGALDLSEVSILHGQFPEVGRGMGPGCITARAVEKPESFLKEILSLVDSGALFLCQHGFAAQSFPDRYLVEPVDDLWKTLGLRRGEVWLVRAVAGTGIE